MKTSDLMAKHNGFTMLQLCHMVHLVTLHASWKLSNVLQNYEY